MDNPERRYAIYVAADQMDQAYTFLRQALSVLRPTNTAYPSVRQALDLVEAERDTARADVETLEGTREDYVVKVEATGTSR